MNDIRWRYPQRRHKLALRIYNYSYLDRFDQPLEYRVNHQLRARSAEVLYTRDRDFEPVEIGRRLALTEHPYPHKYETVGEQNICTLQTPEHGIFTALAEPHVLFEYTGYTFEAPLAGRLWSTLTAREHVDKTRDTLRTKHAAIVTRIERTWGMYLGNLLDKQTAFVYYYAANRRSVEHIGSVLQKLSHSEYLTLRYSVSFGPGNSKATKHAEHFYIVHEKLAKALSTQLADIL